MHHHCYSYRTSMSTTAQLFSHGPASNTRSELKVATQLQRRSDGMAALPQLTCLDITGMICQSHQNPNLAFV